MEFPSKPLTQLIGSNGPVHALTYSSSPSTYILTGSADRNIRLYNPSRPAASSQPTAPHQPPKPTQLIQTYSAHGYEVLSIAVASTNATFASCGGDRSVFLWDVQTAKTIRKFGGNNGHTSRINSVVFAGSEESLLVSGGFDRSVRIWDIRAGNMKPVMTMEDARDSVSAVLAGKGGDKGFGGGEWEIVSGSVDGRVRWYDIRAGTLETDVIGASVTSLMRTRDGRGVLVGSLDGCVRLMDREGGACLKTYKDEGFKNEEYRVRSCFGGNEKWVLSGNENVKGPDGEVVVWETLTGNVLHRIRVEGSTAEGKKKIGRDGKEKERTNVISAVAWKENGRGDQWCCAGSDGVVTVFGPP
ncbi:hypothetical protein OCU04_001514 [Sclerotinia nivalis]|uniref:WD domain-containing protein n=1 Tax=Sclerotinia nivalis TaxID=352851 RepID=A0A9X0DQQ4_9HELO|nr:hypothetical protein OCU04_001514 [Sclerotinia nivalis]